MKNKQESKQKQLLDREYSIRNRGGPRLADFQATEFENPFMRIKQKNPSWLYSTKYFEVGDEIALRNDKNANIRAFYFMMLSFCFGSAMNRGTDRNQPLLSNLKKYVYAQSTLFSDFCRQYNTKHCKSLLSNNNILKHLLTELFYLLQQGRDLYTLFITYPILDPILLSLMRSIVLTHHYSPLRLKIQTAIPTQILASSLKLQFGARIEFTASEVIFEDCLVMKQEDNYVFLRVGMGDVLESTGTEMEISIIRERGEGREGSKEGTKEILGEFARKCGEIFPEVAMVESEGVIESNGRLIEGEDVPEKIPYPAFTRFTFQAKQAESYIEESGDDSNSSQVISKIQFCKTPRSPNSPTKPSSPRKSPRKSPSSPRKSPHKSPTLLLPAVPQVKRTQQSKLSSQQSSRLEIIHDSQQDDIIEQSVKSRLCDGTTSEAVLKLLSPVLASSLKQVKERSLRNIMEKYNNMTSMANLSIKSISGKSDKYLRERRGSINSNGMLSNVSVRDFKVNSNKTFGSPEDRSPALSVKECNHPVRERIRQQAIPKSVTNSPRSSITCQQQRTSLTSTKEQVLLVNRPKQQPFIVGIKARYLSSIPGSNLH